MDFLGKQSCEGDELVERVGDGGVEVFLEEYCLLESNMMFIMNNQDGFVGNFFGGGKFGSCGKVR